MKKNKLLAVLALTTLSLGLATSCGGAKETMSNQDIVNAVIKDSSILIDNNATPMRPNSYSTAYNELTGKTGGYLKATTGFKYLSESGLEHDVSINWTFEASQWKVKDYADEKYKELKPIYESNVETGGTATFTIKGEATYNDAKASATYEIHVVNDKTYTTIKDLGSAKGSVAIQGYVTGIIDKTDDKGNPYGVYVQDGDYGMMLYKPTKAVAQSLNIGDAVEILGEVSPYNNTNQITGSSAVVSKLAADEVREGVLPANIPELEDVNNIKTDRFAAMFKMTGAKVVECSTIANVYNGKETENAWIQATLRYKGKDVIISSDRYNADYEDKLKFYNMLKEAKDSNGQKTIDYTGPVGKVQYATGIENGETKTERADAGFTFIDTSFVKVSDTAYVPVSGIKLSTDKDILRVGETAQLTHEVIDIEDTTVKYSVDNDKVATVDDKGKVTAKADGKVVVTCASVAKPEVKQSVTINVAKKMTMAEVYNAGKSKYVEFDGIFTGEYKGKQNYGIFVADGETSMFLYGAKKGDLKVGDKVNVSGKTDLYKAGFQVANTDIKVSKDAQVAEPVKLEIKDNLTGIDGKDTGREVTVSGTIKEVTTDSYGTVYVKITLSDGKTEVTVKGDNRYIDEEVLTALSALKAGETITLNGNICFEDKDKYAPLPTDSTGLHIGNPSFPGQETEEKMELTNSVINGGEAYTDTNKYSPVDLTLNGLGLKGKLGLGKYGENKDPVIAMRASFNEDGSLKDISYLYNTTALDGVKTIRFKWNASSVAKYGPELPNFYFSDKVITGKGDLEVTKFNEKSTAGETTYTVTVPEGKNFFYFEHSGVKGSSHTQYIDSIEFVK